MGILNYIFIGFILAFILDYLSLKLKSQKINYDMPDWDWSTRTIFALIWPIGMVVFIYTFLKTRFKK